MPSDAVVHVLRYPGRPAGVSEHKLAARGIRVVSWTVDDALPEQLSRTGAHETGLYWAKLDGAPTGMAHQLAADAVAKLESAGNRVVNGGPAMRLRRSHVARLSALGEAGFATPRTVVAPDRRALRTAARGFEAPFLVRAEAGGPAHRFDSQGELEYFCADRFTPLRGRWLVQEIVGADSARPALRLGFVGGRLATVAPARTPLWSGRDARDGPRLVALPDALETELVRAYESFLELHRLDIAAIEVGRGGDGQPVTFGIDLDPSCGTDAAASDPRVAATAGDRIMQFIVELMQRTPQPGSLAG